MKHDKLTRIHINISDVTLYDYCLRCGKKLKTYESRRLGYGSACYKKYMKEKIRHKNLL